MTIHTRTLGLLALILIARPAIAQTTDVYAIAMCWRYQWQPNGEWVCDLLENRRSYLDRAHYMFSTEAACRASLAQFQGRDESMQLFRCMKQTTPAWQPID